MASRSQKAPRWRQWSEDEARSVLARLDASGQSVAEFARFIGVSPHRITYWRSKLAAPPSAPFVPVRLATHSAIELAIGPVSLRLPEGTSAERVADLLAAIARKVGAC
jgi:transposase-like protein